MLREVPAGIIGLAILFLLVGGRYLFALALPLGAVAVAMKLFPGATPPKDIDAVARSRYYVRNAPSAHKFAWLVFGVAGVALGVVANAAVGRVR